MSEVFSFDALSGGSLVLTLDRACIQSAAKHAHRELSAALLAGRPGGAPTEAMVDLLEKFLGTADFPTLRVEHPELVGDTPCRVRLYRQEDKAVSSS